MLGPLVCVASASVAPKTAATAPSMPACDATLRPKTVITWAGGALVHADCTQPPSAPKPAPAIPRCSALEMTPPSPPPPLAGILDCRHGAACQHSSQAHRGAGVRCGVRRRTELGLGCSATTTSCLGRYRANTIAKRTFVGRTGLQTQTDRLASFQLGVKPVCMLNKDLHHCLSGLQLSNADHPTTGLMLSSLMLSKAEVPISKSELAPSTGRGP